MTVTWSRTKAALAHLEELLKCDLCRNTVSDPCTLGSCDHYFCRECLAPFVGKQCPTCHLPSHAKDIQPYHLIRTTVLHCSELKTLLESSNFEPQISPEVKFTAMNTDLQGTEITDILTAPEKENLPEDAELRCSTVDAINNDVYEFNPTPPFRKINRCRIPKLSKRRKITDNNKKWGIGNDTSTGAEDVLHCETLTNESSRKRVSFTSSLSSTPVSGMLTKSPSANNSLPSKVTASTPCKLDTGTNKSLPLSSDSINRSRWKSFTKESIKSRHSSISFPATQMKEEDSRSSSGKLPGSNVSVDEAFCAADDVGSRSVSPAFESQTCSRLHTSSSKKIALADCSNGNSSAAKISESSLETASNLKIKSSGHDNFTPQNNDTSLRGNHSSTSSSKKQLYMGLNGPKHLQDGVRTSTDSNLRKKQEFASRRHSADGTPPTPKARKLNAKGESALHLACIKGNFEMVQKLLQQGENPNVKDNAGWTPLHEACNHGFKNIVILLLDNGALINAPGMNNDTPLHDAVTNYHIEVVRLLVSRGADATLRNREGRTPKDCAQTREMQQALQSPVLPAPLPLVTGVLSSSPPVNMAFLSTGLSKEERTKLNACAEFLGASIVTEFNRDVTHLIASCNKLGLCPRTLKYMHAVVAGKWIVSFDWVEACLKSSTHVNEEFYEVEGSSSNPQSKAPRKARLNAQLQYPPIFDGCHFYFYGKYINPTPSKNELMDLARSGGAQLLRREPKPSTLNVTVTAPFHAPIDSSLKLCSHYLLYQKGVDEPIVKHNLERLRTLQVSWLLDSIAAFALLDPLPYVE